MKILLLSEGDAETWDSWSGSSKSVVDHLRAAGHTVVTGDVDLYGISRWWGIARTFKPEMAHWQASYRLGAKSFRSRSKVAAAHIKRHSDVDLILQIGATFAPEGRGDIPYALYCDSNVKVAERWRVSGFTYATPLSHEERAAIADRERKVYEGASMIFTICERLRESFINDFRIPADRVYTVHAGPNFDTSAIPEQPFRPADSHVAPKVLFVGKDFERKGGTVLLEAFRRVRPDVPSAELVIIGPLDLKLDEPGVRVLGRLNKDTEYGARALARAYSEASVFALPTRFDSLGVVFLEAMFYGLPCIGSDHWAVPEMVIDGKTGYIVPTDDVDVLTDRLRALLTEPETASRMGRAGLKLAREHFTWAAVVDRMLMKLESLQPAGMVHG